MNHLIKKITLLALGLNMIAPLAGNARPKKMDPNPLLVKSPLPYGAPRFSKISEFHYVPAVKVAIQTQRANIQRIVENKEAPNFQNTIVALERSGEQLNSVLCIFYAVNGAHKTEGIEISEKTITPLVSAFGDEVNFNEALFARVKQVYDQEHNRLQGEDLRLLEETYKGFVRSGALLDKAQKARMEEINARLSQLQTEFTTLLPKATASAAVWVQTKEELKGLSEGALAQCAQDAKRLGGKAPYCIVITNTVQQPILSSLENRDLRKRVYEASIHRADGTGEFNTSPLIVEMARLRAEKAQLMGYATWADFSLSKTIAGTPQRVRDFLGSLIKEYRPLADAETREIEQYAQRTEGKDFRLQPYDRMFYSAKMKAEKFQFTEDDVMPYFNLDSVLVNGVFYAAEKAYGLHFKRRTDLPTYHPDMQVYEITDKSGKTISLFYTDFYRRPTKRGGAWMSSFAKQSSLTDQLPIIYNVCNVAKAPEGQPTLLSWDETQTLFHEFGHALHGILSQCKYNTLSGTAVPRDFVELPSQFNEYFASQPEVFAHYARHYATGEAMPTELRNKMLASNTFHAAYSLGENLAASSLDLQWHMLTPSQVPSAEGIQAFQTGALSGMGILDEQIPPRYLTSTFNHVWGGGYAAGYYSYLWTEVLAVNVGDTFTKRGALNGKTGDDFRRLILSKGYTVDLMKAFSDFTGLQQPDASGFMKARGLK